jgi:predicted aminopeptidase
MRKPYWLLDCFMLSGFAMLLVSFSEVDYGLRQLAGQLRIVFNAVPVEDMLKDSTSSVDLKSKLRYVEKVKLFGVEKLGLKPTRNYRCYYDQHGKPLLWVVTASEEFQLKPYQWHFPFLGSVSYKGFFDLHRADKLAQRLKSEQWDVYTYEVGAWSTLGWLRDPILSGMLEREEGQLAELILHELTHATVYLKNEVDYNENLASFIGEQGALLFLEQEFGDTSRFYLNYRNQLADDNAINHHLINGARTLDSMYSSPAFPQTGNTRRRLKSDMLYSIVLEMDTLSLNDSLRLDKLRKRKWNNAHFLSYLRYDAKKDSMRMEMIRLDHGNLKTFIQRVAQAAGTR